MVKSAIHSTENGEPHVNEREMTYILEWLKTKSSGGANGIPKPIYVFGKCGSFGRISSVDTDLEDASEYEPFTFPRQPSFE